MPRQLRRHFILLAALAGLGLGTTSIAAAKEKEPQPRPELIQKLFDCRDIADTAARLACYDQQVAGLETAEANREIKFADRETVKKVRRGLFGFSLGDLPLFGGGDDDEDAIKQFDAMIKSARRNGAGQWQITLETGAVWAQTDTKALVHYPEAGDKIVIEPGAVGNFFAKINGNRSFRIRRER